MSSLDPLTCGFAKVFVYEVLARDKELVGKSVATNQISLVYHQQYDEFVAHFAEGTGFEITYNQFKKLLHVKETIQTVGKNSSEKKQLFLETFSRKKWNDLKARNKTKHSYKDCQACLSNEIYRLPLSYLPVKATSLKRKAEQAGLYKPKRQVVCDAAKEAFENIDETFRKEFSTSFEKAARVYLDKEKNQHLETLKRSFKDDVEAQMKKSCVARLFGSNMSKTQFNKQRLLTSFESHEDAVVRFEANQTKINDGLIKEKDHVGNISNQSWNSEECLAIVNSLPNDSTINYSSLAREFGLLNALGETPKNGGQIVRSFLETSGCDTSRFKSYADMPRIRRSRKKLTGSRISVPSDPTMGKIDEALKELIDKGVYTLGQKIVPQEFESLVLDNGEIKRNVIQVDGRKNPIEHVRNRMLTKHWKYMRTHSDDFYDNIQEDELKREFDRIEESFDDLSVDDAIQRLKSFQRRRHLACWHDTSDVSNHSHLLIVFICLYDVAIFYTDEEYFQKTGLRVDIEATVEKPELYLLARCPSSDKQIIYGNERLSDLRALSENPLATPDGYSLNDVMRIFKGDAPACQFEAGHQKGGHYFCWNCGLVANRTQDLTYSLQLNITTLQDKIDKITSSWYGKSVAQERKLHYFDKMDKDEILLDLHERKIKVQGENKENLLKMLQTELAGCQRLPALIFNQPQYTNLNEVHLQRYEVLPCEPLHTISNHIKNLYEEVPFHLSKDEKKVFRSFVTASFAGKEAKRAADYRLSLVDVTIALKNKINLRLWQILENLCEIQQILYSNESHRTSVWILRLHNLTFLHAIHLKDFIKDTKHLTNRKFYGQYFHSLICHSPQQYRIISGSSSNAEEEERAFNFLKVVSASTSNHHPDNVLLNAFTRLQVREELQPETIKSGIESKISKHYEALKNEKNSFISFEFIEKHPWDYQAHLERIADYLLTSQFWFETAEGIEFRDTHLALTQSIKKHHFRSSTIKEEQQYLENCWEQCLQKPELIPAFKIKVENDEVVSILHLETLSKLHKPVIIDFPEHDFQQDHDATMVCDLPSTPLGPRFKARPMVETTPITPFSATAMAKVDDHFSSTPLPKPVTEEMNSHSIDFTITAPSQLESHASKNDNLVQVKEVGIRGESGDNGLGNTAKLLTQVLSNLTLIKDYDKKRKLLKKNKSACKVEFEQISAQVEVQLVSKRMELTEKLNELELTCFKNSKTISFKMSEQEKEQHDSILKKLRIIKHLSKQFNI